MVITYTGMLTGLCVCVWLLPCVAGLLPCCGCSQGVKVPQQVHEQAYEGLKDMLNDLHSAIKEMMTSVKGDGD